MSGHPRVIGSSALDVVPAFSPLAAYRVTATLSATGHSAQARPSARADSSRIATLRILPVTVIGNSSTTRT